MCVVLFIKKSGNDVTMLLEPRNDVTRAFVMFTNVPYNERQHFDVLKATSRSKPIHVLYFYKMILKIKQQAIWKTTHTRI